MPVIQLLVVEDENVVAMHIEATLKNCGYGVQCVSSGEEALGAAARLRPDLVLMDIMLAGSLDGIQTAERLRADLRLPVVYLTAHADQRTLERAKATEPLGYVLKPFRENELRAAVEIALTRRNIETKLREKEGWYTAILETVDDGIVIIGLDRRVTFINRVLEELVNAQEAVGRDFSAIFQFLPADKRGHLERAVNNVLSRGAVVELLDFSILLRLSPTERYIADSVAPMQDAAGRTCGAVVIFRVVGERRQIREMVGNGRTHAAGDAAVQPDGLAALQKSTRPEDPLTGLPGRQAAEEALEAAHAQGLRLFAAPFILERFALLKERLGKAAANDVVLFYSVHLAQHLSASDQLFRWGPSSFLVLFERTGSAMDVRREMAGLASVRLEKLIQLSTRTALVPVSAEWTIFPVFENSSIADVTQEIAAFVEARLGVSPAVR